MAAPGNIKSGVQDGCGSQRKRDSAAQAKAADLAAAPYDQPACSGGKGSDAQHGAYRIDDEQQEDDPETAQCRAREIGRIEPSAAIGQARQQKCYANAAFGKRPNE